MNQRSHSNIVQPSTPSAIPSQGQGQGQRSIIEIYTDWANHYLDKLSGNKTRITDLQSQLSDGIVLSDVIEAVTGQKVSRINRKPKTSQDKVGNIQMCLEFLIAKGVQVQEVQAKEVKEGNLKSILGLFFQLSRFKQQQKMMQRGQGVEPRGQGLEQRCLTPRIPSVPNSPAKGGSSAIPMPNSASKIGKLGPRQNSASALRPPQVKTGLAQSKSNLAQSKSNLPQTPKTSMLEKLKFKKSNPQQQQPVSQQPVSQQPVSQLPTPGNQMKYNQYREKGLGKRTSSSSGFSSARSVGSESSVSLSSDTNFPSPSALRRINEHSTFSSPVKKRVGSPVSKSPAKFSPKRSPKFSRNQSNIKDYGPIDSQNYPPHSAQQKQKKIPVPQSAEQSRIQRIPKMNSQSSVKKIPVPKSGDEQPEVKPNSNVAVVSPMPSLKRGMSLDKAAAEAAMAAAAPVNPENNYIKSENKYCTGNGINSVTGNGINSVTGNGINSTTGKANNSITGNGINSITKIGTTGNATNGYNGNGMKNVTGNGKCPDFNEDEDESLKSLVPMKPINENHYGFGMQKKVEVNRVEVKGIHLWAWNNKLPKFNCFIIN